MGSFQPVLPFSAALLFPVPLGERHLLPSCPRHTGYCGLRRTLQLLGQRHPHKVKDLRAAGPANHGVLLQSQRQHLCVRLQLRLVEGGRGLSVFVVCLGSCCRFLSHSSCLYRTSSGPRVLQPPEKELHLPEERC